MCLNKNKNILQKFFKEKFLIFDSGEHGGHGGGINLKDFVSPSSEKRAGQLNNLGSAAEHNTKMIKAASEEIQKPLQDAITNTRTEISKFADLPGVLINGVRGGLKNVVSAMTTPITAIGNTAVSVVSGTTKIATQLVTNPLGLAFNIPRIGADAIRLAARPPLIFADYLAKLVGRPSAWIKTFRTKAPEKIDHTVETIKKTCAGIRDSVLDTIGGAGGHGLVPAHAH